MNPLTPTPTGPHAFEQQEGAIGSRCVHCKKPETDSLHLPQTVDIPSDLEFLHANEDIDLTQGSEIVAQAIDLALLLPEDSEVRLRLLGAAAANLTYHLNCVRLTSITEREIQEIE